MLRVEHDPSIRAVEGTRRLRPFSKYEHVYTHEYLHMYMHARVNNKGQPFQHNVTQSELKC